MKKIGKSFLMIVMVLGMLCPHVLADTDGEASSNNRYIFSGNDAVNTGTDNGFSKSKPIKKGDPHYGWSLGDFCITGYTSYVIDDDGTVVFLKNVGDKVKLSFELQHEKDALNGDEDIQLHYDKKAYDEYFQTKKYQHSMGLLVMQRTDYQNKPDDLIIFESFLEDTETEEEKEVQLCEEGDYEVALDYELEVDGSLLGIGLIDKDSYEDYRIFFKFKVRNGNCMVFPKDLSGNELTNESYSEEGFFIDLAKSRYLEIYVRHFVLSEGKNGMTEDARHSGPAADGEKYTRPGIYEIEVKNKYTKQTTTKKVYVGEDPEIRMLAISNAVPEESDKSANPVKKDKNGPPEVKNEQNSGNGATVIICVVVSVVIVAVISLVFINRKKHKKTSSVTVEDADSQSDVAIGVNFDQTNLEEVSGDSNEIELPEDKDT